jgi:hypothetical protein
MTNADETYLLHFSTPFLIKLIWGFLVWLGCLQIRKHNIVKVAYLSIIMVLLLEVQGQIILSYLFGFLWISGRDTYLIEFSFTVIAVFGLLTSFWLKPVLLRLTPFFIAFSSFPAYYTLPFESIPGYANPLITPPLPHNPYTGTPELIKLITELKEQQKFPYQRMLDPDMDTVNVDLLHNQGSFLLAGIGNVAFYGSMTPTKYSELIRFHGYGITPDDNVGGYPSVYSETTISRLPKVNTKRYSNNFIYYLTQYTIPPLKADLLRILGVTHIITRNRGLKHMLYSLRTRVKVSGDFYVAELPNSFPRAFLATNITQNNLDEFETSMKPNIILEGSSQRIGTDAFIAKPATILEYKPEYVKVEAKSSSGGYLVLSDVFHPYWSATVDGEIAEIIPAFHAFRAVKIPSGKHTVEFICKVPYFKGAFFISILLVVICFSLTLFFWNKKVMFSPKHRNELKLENY